MTQIEAVCSNRPSPPSKVSGKGHQWWARDIYHLRSSAERGKTLCGRDCSEWLSMEPVERAALDADGDVCTRCLSKLRKEEGPR